MKDKVHIAFIIVAVIALVVLLALWPIVIIWAINTLFPLLSIPYSFFTWLAVCVLNVSTFGGLAAIMNKIEKKI